MKPFGDPWKTLNRPARGRASIVADPTQAVSTDTAAVFILSKDLPAGILDADADELILVVIRRNHATHLSSFAIAYPGLNANTGHGLSKNGVFRMIHRRIRSSPPPANQDNPLKRR
jgi:hypothetical protein